jgi:endogenous inhibitor of DNA gyrase (YacG/DUF329 family)
MTHSEPPAKPAGKCPICGRPSVQACRPFCSRRCADVDLARWLSGAYAIPVADRDDDEDGSPLGVEGGKDEPGTRH